MVHIAWVLGFGVLVLYFFLGDLFYLCIKCGGLNETGPHRLTDLNAWAPVGETGGV